MDFDTWLQQKGITGRIPRQAAIKLQDQWMKDTKGGGNFQPSIVAVTNPITQEVSPAFMSSANSATLMRDSQPRTQYKPDKEGNLLAIEGTTANYVTNTTGERIKVDPKSNAMADMLAAMSGMGGQAPAEESPGILSRIFGGVPATNAPTPTPTPMPSPSPTPEMQRTAGPAVPTGTNAMTTPEQIRAAFMAGQISEADAVRLLRGGR
jgi:hypothetical protein